VRVRLRFAVTAALATSGLIVGAGLLGSALRGVVRTGNPVPDEGVAQLATLDERSLLYARDGSLMAQLHAEKNRAPVALADVPPIVSRAIVDVEDDKFWVHNGVNLSSTVRAMLANVTSGRVAQGGSTITQQLVKNSLLTPEKSVGRKMREAVLAVRLERKLTKAQILERYLNAVYFGNGAYGVQAAAETYFDEGVDRLTPAQAALLAGIIRNPVGYDPIRFPLAAKLRRDVALQRMVVEHDLTSEQADALSGEALPTRLFSPVPQPEDYFVEEVKQRLLADPRVGATPRARYNAVFRGGLRIYTTLDRRLQALAVDKVRAGLPDTNGKFQGALISVEPGNGAVRAMVGGESFADAHYNLATARGGSGRQPGSSFKPFVLMAALESGHSPNDTIDGVSPCPVKVPGFAPYSPENVEGESAGVETLVDATVHSVNCAYVRLGADIGLSRIVNVASRFGIKDRRPYPSISLGAQEVSPLEMATAYAAIADDGMYYPPRFVERVLDRNGKLLFGGPEKGTRAVPAQIARETTDVLRQVIARGTGQAAAVAGRDVAGKTGTSENYENAWFVGYSANLATAVWMGDPLANVPMRDVGGIRVFGGTYPAHIWSAYMGGALDLYPDVSMPGPDPSLVPPGQFIVDRYSTNAPSSAPPASAPPNVTPKPTPPPKKHHHQQQ